MKLSIIVPVYNVAEYLHRCFNSILDQNFTDFELIIVEDGSIDSSLSICREFQSKDNRIIIYTQCHAGVSIARNRGLNYAKGEYVIFIDADDWLDIDMFSTLIDISDLYSCDLVACNYYVNDIFQPKTPQYKNLTVLAIDDAIKMSFDLNPHSFSANCWNKLFRIDVIRNNSLEFDESITIGEDFVFLVRYLLVTKRDITFIDSPKYHYFLNKKGAMSIKFNEQKVSVIEAHHMLRDLLISKDEMIKALNKRSAIVAYRMLLQSIRANYQVKSIVIRLQEETKYLRTMPHPEIFNSYKDKIKIFLSTYNFTTYKLCILLNRCLFIYKSRLLCFYR